MKPQGGYCISTHTADTVEAQGTHGLLLPCTTGDFSQQRQALETIDSTVEGEVVKNMTCAVVLYDFVYLSIFVFNVSND